jgi:Lon protease-like protein
MQALPQIGQIALFPLSTVLFPGGLLPLRIFETRYVDMVGHCLRTDEVFGVVLIRGGSETSSAVDVAPVGTSARIVDFQRLADGLLGLLCRGERRFAIQQRSQQSDGLNRATVEWLPETPTALAEEFRALLPVLRRVLSEMDNIGRFVQANYEDACWVGYRLAELLPLEPASQQRLLEMHDPHERLRLLAPLIETGAQPD